MENKEDILKKLNSEDPEIWAEATGKIKSEGDLTIIPDLLDLLTTEKNHLLTKEIINVLADIKDSGFIPLLMNRIKSVSQPIAKSLLLRVTWESSLDFSEYAEDFVKMLLEDDFIVALEAGTTLENLEYLDKKRKTSLLSQLKQAQTTDEKQFLIGDILNTWDQESETEE